MVESLKPVFALLTGIMGKQQTSASSNDTA